MEKKKEEPAEKSAAPSNVTVMLRTGAWKTVFTGDTGEILLAEALNATVTATGFHHALAGYLFTPRRVCLVLYLEEKKVQSFLHLFYDEVKKLLRQYEERVPQEKLSALYETQLFHPLTSANPWLTELLLGKKVRLPYENPQLTRLKERLRNYRFCSALDYTGAKSPVLVALQKQHH